MKFVVECGLAREPSSSAISLWDEFKKKKGGTAQRFSDFLVTAKYTVLQEKHEQSTPIADVNLRRLSL